jgi:RelA/SpoT family (p)ppGpp synthetase
MMDLESSSKSFLNYILEFLPHIDFPKVEKALNFAIKAHKGQRRASGEEYATHPLAVARILAELHLDTVCIVVGLLHDVLEDTDTSFEELEKLFGTRVANLVLALTKLNKLEGQSLLLKKSENLKRLLLAVAEDTRALIVKLADRLHNMQTLKAIASPQKRFRIAKETMELYAPLADRIGFHFFKNQLYELAFEILYPRIRAALVHEIEKFKAREYHDIITIMTEISRVMVKSKIQLEVKGREKSPFSIWQKMANKRILFNKLSDIFAVRIITQNIQDCYKALGVIHANYKVLSNEFCDYISTPKANGYRSLHTVILFAKNIRVEIQVRTQEMHYLSELGMSAHWIYKQKEGIISEKDRGIWLQNIRIIMGNLANNSDFLSQMRLDHNYDEVFCITPVGDIINLQKGSTILDLAFEIDEKKGFYAIRGLVNGLSVPLDYQLKNGDQVEIINGKQKNIPHNALDFIKIDKTRRIIETYLDKEVINNRLLFKKTLLLNKNRFFTQNKFIKFLLRKSKVLLDFDKILSIVTNFSLFNKIKLFIQNHKNISLISLNDDSNICLSYCCPLEANSRAIGIYSSITNRIILHSYKCNNIKINSQEKLYKILLPDQEDFSQNQILDITVSDCDIIYDIFKIVSFFGLSNYKTELRLFGEDLIILTISFKGMISFQLKGLIKTIQSQAKVLQVQLV